MERSDATRSENESETNVMAVRLKASIIFILYVFDAITGMDEI